MNYNQKNSIVFAVIRLPKKGVYGKHKRGRTISHEKFFSIFAPLFLTFYAYQTI